MRKNDTNVEKIINSDFSISYRISFMVWQDFSFNLNKKEFDKFKKQINKVN